MEHLTQVCSGSWSVGVPGELLTSSPNASRHTTKHSKTYPWRTFLHFGINPTNSVVDTVNAVRVKGGLLGCDDDVFAEYRLVGAGIQIVGILEVLLFYPQLRLGRVVAGVDEIFATSPTVPGAGGQIAGITVDLNLCWNGTTLHANSSQVGLIGGGLTNPSPISQSLSVMPGNKAGIGTKEMHGSVEFEVFEFGFSHSVRKHLCPTCPPA